MSDDYGPGSDSGGGSSRSGRPGDSYSSSSSLGVIRRAMRWETFALAAFLVVLALLFG